MADRLTLASLGRMRTYADAVNAGSAVILVVLLRQGVEADSTLIDRATLADVLAVTANREASWEGGTPYARKALTAVTVSPQAANDRVDYDLADVVWAAAGQITTPQQLAKLGVCYAPAANAQNTAVVPLAWLDYPVIADGSDLAPAFSAQGFYRSTAS